MLVYGIAESYGSVEAISSIVSSKFSYLGFGLPFNVSSAIIMVIFILVSLLL